MAQSLEDVFKFTPDDLIQNRSGQLSAKQSEYLQKHNRLTGCYTWVAIIFVFLSMLGLFFVAYREMGDTDQSPALAIIGGTFGVAFLIVMVFVWIGRFRARDVRADKISIAEGQASLSTKKLRTSGGMVMHAYYVTIGKIKFQVHNTQQYEAFKPDSRYRVYYVKNPPVHIILSLEVLP